MGGREAFSGSRKAFLVAQKLLFAEAMVGNHVSDTLADIQRRYLKRYPIDLPHDEEPTSEALARVDDDAADPEVASPNESEMSAEEYKIAKTAFEERGAAIQAHKEQIKRWFTYQYNKDKNLTASFDLSTKNPMAILMAKLTGTSMKKPRKKTAYNLWGPANRHFVDPIFEDRVKSQGVPVKMHAALRSKIYKEMFNELDEEEKAEWEKKAVAEHEKVMSEMEEVLKALPSTKPEDRQKVIQGLSSFVTPILDMICVYSGLKATLIAGGPEPADGGCLNVVSIHSGTTSGNLKMNFGRSERRAYKETVVPVFGEFLKKCYTIEECRASALPVKDGALATLNLEDDNVNLDSADWDLGSGGVGLSQAVAAPTSSTTASASTTKVDDKDAGNKKRHPMKDHQPPSESRGHEKTTKKQKSAPQYVPPAGLKIGPPKKAHHNNSEPASVPIVGVPAQNVSAPPVTSSAPTATVGAGANSIDVQSSHVARVLGNAEKTASSPTSVFLPLSPNHLLPSPSASFSRPSPTLSPRQHSPILSTAYRSPALPNHQSPLQCLLDGAVQRTPTTPTPTSGRGVNMPVEIGPSMSPNLFLVDAEPMATTSTDVDLDTTAAKILATTTSDPMTRKRTGSASADGHNDKAKKRSKTLTVVAPSSSPLWVKEAVAMFSSANLGDKWVEAVCAWLHFEEQEGFKGTKYLGARHRPECITDWIQRARSVKYRPSISSPQAFARQFNQWWQGLQPDQKRTQDGGLAQRLEPGVGRLALAPLHCAGVNGLFSVFTCLFFWGTCIKKSSAKKEWVKSLEDVTWVVRQLAEGT